MSTPRARRRSLVAAMVLAAVMLLGMVQAQAAGLSLTADGMTFHTQTFSRTCFGPAQAAPSGASVGGTYTHLTVTGLNSSCSGIGYVSLRTSTGTVVVDATAPVSNGTFTVTIPAYTPPSASTGQVFVSVDTWPVQATWAPVVSLGTCTVVNGTGNPTTKPCQLTNLTGQSNNDGKPVGSRTWQMYLYLSAPTMQSGGGKNSESAEIWVNLAAATGMPGDWQWGTSGVVGGNLTAYPGASCSTLPTLHAYAPGWSGGGAALYFSVVENRTGVSGLICS